MYPLVVQSIYKKKEIEQKLTTCLYWIHSKFTHYLILGALFEIIIIILNTFRYNFLRLNERDGIIKMFNFTALIFISIKCICKGKTEKNI